MKSPMARRTPFVLAALTLIAVAGFILVSRLVTRYHANERQLAWHVFQEGQNRYQAGDMARALEDYRTALTYDPDNFQYQLSLARALRDSGRLDESAAYLQALWQRNPEDGVVNLALARLAVRRGSLQDALRYYHNAIYGAWDTDAAERRRAARLELIHVLLQQKAFTQAESELLDLDQALPPEPAWHLQVADLFSEIGDFDRSLQVYDQLVKNDPRNLNALRGAGNAALQLGRYRSAQQYLTRAVENDPADQKSRAALETVNLVLSVNPFERRISNAERYRRVTFAFNIAGERLQSCAASRGVDLKTSTSPPNQLQVLQASWTDFQPQLRSRRSIEESDLVDNIMDLVAQIETQTEQQCGSPTGSDLALLVLSRRGEMVDQ